MIKKGIIILLFLISSINLMGQGFTYSYADPCTLKTKEIYIPNPNGSVALFYGGQTQSFTSSELQSGAFQQWINQVNSTNPSGPCSGVALVQNTTLNAIVAQNSIAVLSSVISTLSDISSISDMSTMSTIGGSTIEGIIQVDESVSSNNNGDVSKDNKKQNNNGTTNNTNGNQTTSGGIEGQNNVQTNQNGTQQVGGNNSSQGATVGNSNNTTSGGEQTTQSSVTSSSNGQSSNQNNNPSSTPQVTTNQPSSNPVTSGNQNSSQTTNNQGNNSVSSNNPVTSGNNSTVNTNNPTTPNTNNSTSNQNSQNSSGNNQNSQVVSENQNSQGQNNGVITNQGQTQGQNVTNTSSNNGGVTNITGGVNSVKADVTEKNDKEDAISSVESTSAQSSSTTKSKVATVKKGSLMMTGDIVTISSASGMDPTQVKINASIISSNTKNTIAKGALVNFTSQINNSNVTLFFSYRHKRFTSIIANSMMINFEKDFFNTISLMESYQYKKLTSTIGVNLTTGNIGESKFQSVSTLGGFVYNYKVNKKFGMTTMFVMVYSPFVYYYEGMWYQSGLLAVPFVAVDYKITKKFKLNLSFSGVNQINDQTLNYQVLIGAKAFL